MLMLVSCELGLLKFGEVKRFGQDGRGRSSLLPVGLILSSVHVI